jgi:hypothetical protein
MGDIDKKIFDLLNNTPSNGEEMFKLIKEHNYLENEMVVDMVGLEFFSYACRTNNLELMTLLKELGCKVTDKYEFNGIVEHISNSREFFDPQRVIPHLISLGVEVTRTVVDLYNFIEISENDPVFNTIVEYYDKEKYGPHESIEINIFGVDRINYFKEKLLTEINTSRYHDDPLYHCEYNSSKSFDKDNGRYLVHRVYRDGRGFLQHMWIDARAIPLIKNDIKILDVSH